MRGFIHRRGPGWELRVYLGRDPDSGARRYATRTVRGSRTEAERVLRVMVDAAESGMADRSRSTFAELCAAWLEHAAARLAPNTMVEARRIIDLHLVPALGDMQLRALRTEHLDRLYRQLLTEGSPGTKPLSPDSVRRVHGVAARALHVGVQWGWIPASPAYAVALPRSRRRPIRPPDPAGVARLLEIARATQPDLATYLLVAATTGARRGELCGLRWSDVDLTRATLDIVRGIVLVAGVVTEAPTKTRRSRHIALDRLTVAELTGHHERITRRATRAGVAVDADGFVFSVDPTGARPWRPDATTRAFRKVAAAAGLETTRLHDLRHYVATRLLVAGIDVRTVAGRLGHAHPSTTLNVYAAFVPDADQQAAEIMGQLLTPPPVEV